VPSVSIKGRSAVVPVAEDAAGRIAVVRRRIAERFYDRPEVRRTVAALILKSLARASRRAGSPRPETA
jgi:hypothetical protein